VPDQKPPRLHGDERETVLALLQYQRDSLVRKATGVDEAAARRVFVDSGTTLLWLMQHMAQAESLWILQRFAGKAGPRPENNEEPDDTLVTAIEAYQRVWARTDAVVARSGLDDLCRDGGDESAVNLRWVLLHLLEETARHAGHADILRELIDGQTGR
jgi:hypothetical protein